MLKIERHKILVKILKRLEMDVGQRQEVRGNTFQHNNFDDIDSVQSHDEDVLFQIKTPTSPYNESAWIDSLRYKSDHSLANSTNISVPTESVGWPPGIVEFILRTVIIAVDTTLDSILSAQEMDNNIDNILRGSNPD